MVEDPKTKDLLGQTKKSRDEDSEGLGSWRVVEHADWLDVGRELTLLNRRASDEKRRDGGEEMDVDGKVEDLRGVVARFERENEDVKVMVEEGESVVRVRVPAPANMGFSMHREDGLEGIVRWRVVSEGKSKFQEKIVESVNERSKGLEIGSLLVSLAAIHLSFALVGSNMVQELLAAYRDTKSRPCDKCSRLIDTSGQLPVVRVKDTTRKIQATTRSWRALHHLCS